MPKLTGNKPKRSRRGLYDEINAGYKAAMEKARKRGAPIADCEKSDWRKTNKQLFNDGIALENMSGILN